MPPSKKPEAPTQQQVIEQTPPEPKQEPRVLVLRDPAIGGLVPAAPPSPEEVLQLAENQIKIRKGYVKLVSAFLKPHDILVFGEEIYLPARPCQDILSWARIRVTPHWPVQEYRYDSPDGPFIEFVITATITDSGGRPVDVMGNRSTRDEFFGISGKTYVCPTCKGPLARRKAYPNDKWESNFCDAGNHGKVKADVIVHYLPLFDVDIPSVRSAAVTNLWNKALKACGLMPTLQDLEETGMDISKVKRIDFKSDGKQAPQAQSQPKQTASPKTAPASQTPPPQPSSVSPSTGPPKAVIPPSNFGNLQAFKKLKTQKGSDYGIATLRGTDFFVFDNKSLNVGGTRPYTVFELLDLAASSHWICQFTIESFVGKKDGKTGWRIVGASKIGEYEWDDQGVPVIRRQANAPDLGGQEQPGDAYEATDDDFPAGLYEPK